MNVAVRGPMTPEFLDWEDRQEGRYGFDGFQSAAMAGLAARPDAG